MKALLLSFLCFSPFLLFSQQYASGIITYHSETTPDSLNAQHSLSIGDNIPEAEVEAIKKRIYQTKKSIKYVYFTPTTAWCHSFINMETQTKHAANVIRSYKDSIYMHSLIMDIGTDTIGGQAPILAASGLPTHLQRMKRNKLEHYQRTSDTCQILGYTCYAYRSTEDSARVMWATEDLNLPSMYNTGFMHPEAPIKGVVLRYEHKYGYAEATNIEYCELNESVLRHTPLRELRPEMLRQ